MQSAFGRILYRARRFDAAIPHLNQAIELQPEAAGNYGRLADVYEEMGRYDDALALHEKEKKVSGRAQDLSSAVARIYARMGKADEARRILDLQRTRGSQWFVLATTYAALGDNDEAFRLLFKNTEVRDGLGAYVKVDPPLDSLHSDPRWQVLLRRMNLPIDTARTGVSP